VIEAAHAIEVTGGDGEPVAEAAPLRRQLYAVIEQMTWGGARQVAAKLTALGLTLQQYFTLVAINQGEGCTMSVLATRTHHSFGTMTGIVDRLVRQGFAERRSRPTDRRVVLVRLTPEGTEILAHIENLRAAQLDAVLESLGELQAHNLVRLLTQYVNAANLTDTNTDIDEVATAFVSPSLTASRTGDKGGAE